MSARPDRPLVHHDPRPDLERGTAEAPRERPRMLGPRPDPITSDIYPDGPRGAADQESIIFDEIVRLAGTIPEVSASWMIQEGLIAFAPPTTPYVLVVFHDAMETDQTSTARAIIVTATVRVYASGPDPESQGLSSFRVESELRRLLDGVSIAGLTAPALTEFGRSLPKKLTGGQQNLSMIDHRLTFAYLKAYGA